jgi:hypothetical protein
MSDLVPRRRSNLSHNQRVDRGARLVMATGVGAVVFVVAFLLALVGAISAGIPLAAAIVTGGLAFGAYRTVKR